jgi:hypothetical protein
MEKWHEHALCGHFDQQKSHFKDFYRSQNLKFGPISNSPVVFLVYICLFSLKTKDYATKEYNHWYINHGKRVFSLVAILVFFVELSPFIYIYFFRDFGQTQSTTEETIDIIMLIPSNNNMITILAIKIQKTIKLLKYLQKRDIL